MAKDKKISEEKPKTEELVWVPSLRKWITKSEYNKLFIEK
jgi:hypothetical protein